MQGGPQNPNGGAGAPQQPNAGAAQAGAPQPPGQPPQQPVPPPGPPPGQPPQQPAPPPPPPGQPPQQPGQPAPPPPPPPLVAAPRQPYDGSLADKVSSLKDAIIGLNSTAQSFTNPTDVANNKAHKKFEYWTSPLAIKLESIRTDLLKQVDDDKALNNDQKRNKKENISFEVAKLHDKVQQQHVEMLKGRDTLPQLHTILDDAKDAKLLDAATVTTLKNNELKNNLDYHIKRINEQHQTTHSALFLWQSSRGGAVVRHENMDALQKQGNDSFATVAHGDMSYYKPGFLEKGSYKRPGSDNIIVIDKLAEGFSARVNTKSKDPTTLKGAYREALELLVANKTKKEITIGFDGHPVELDKVILMIRAAEELGIAVKLSNEVRNVNRTDKDVNAKYEAMEAAVKRCNTQAERRKANAESKAMVFDEAGVDSTRRIALDENIKQIKTYLKEDNDFVQLQKDHDQIRINIHAQNLGAPTAAELAAAKSQVPKDLAALETLSKAFKEIERQQWALEQEFKALPPAPLPPAPIPAALQNLNERAEQIKKLSAQCMINLANIDERLGRCRDTLPAGSKEHGEANAAITGPNGQVAKLQAEYNRIKASFTGQHYGQHLTADVNAAGPIAFPHGRPPAPAIQPPPPPGGPPGMKQP